MWALFQGLPPLWDVKGWLRAILSREEHPVLQFIRYGVAGVAAMGANVLFFAGSELLLFPIPESSDAPVPGWPDGWAGLGDWWRVMREDVRVMNYVRCNSVAFVTANAVAYVLNFTWVFRSGRHSRQVEVVLFFAVSLFSFVLGTLLATVWVNHGANEYLAKGADVLTAVLVNYVCRKFLIFQS